MIAGGHSLLPMMKLRLARPEHLVDISAIDELDYIVEDGSVLRIGAMTTHATLLASDVVARHATMIVDAEQVIADPIVRNRGTIGGSLCQADPGEDPSTVCSVLAAELVVTGRDGDRIVPMHEFHVGPYETAVQFDELLTEVRLPLHDHGGSAYEKVERRVGDWAIAAAGVAVWLRDGVIDHGAIGLTAVGLPGQAIEAQAALDGASPDEDTFAGAGRRAAAACAPTDDQRGSAASEHGGVQRDPDDAQPHQAPGEQTDGDPAMTEGQVVGSPGAGDPVTPMQTPPSEAAVSGGAQSDPGARAPDRDAADDT